MTFLFILSILMSLAYVIDGILDIIARNPGGVRHTFAYCIWFLVSLIGLINL